MNDTTTSSVTGTPLAMAAPNINVEMDFLVRIEEQIKELPGSYRFLYTEPKSLNSHYYFVGLNPKGTPTDPADLYIPSGNAFLNENWNEKGDGKNDLQKQVLLLMNKVAFHVGNTEDWITFMNTQCLISNYVFYRSLDWAEMSAKRAHIEQCKRIWRQMFERKTPRIIIANGHDTMKFMGSLLLEQGWRQIETSPPCRAWDGPKTAVYERDEHRCLIVGFAHLSRFKIIDRAANKECLDRLYVKMRMFA